MTPFGPTLLSVLSLLSPVTIVSAAKCQPGLLLPVWWPQENLSAAETAMRGIAYFLAMLYFFLGVSILSDRFLEAIEVMTSKEKEIKVRTPDGEVRIVVTRVWNETVANLTLLALGSSAPEILLSVIEMVGKLAKGDFDSGSGELGPGTIVGSAAFNLLIIIAICVYVIPKGEIRRIKHLNVFFVTATWSVFAYIWLFLILKVISPGVVEIWEGALTFLFFPLTVFTAYVADRRWYKMLSKSYRLDTRGMIVATERGLLEHSDHKLHIFPEEAESQEAQDFEQTRRDFIKTMRKLRKKYPQKDAEELELITKNEIYKKGPKSRAFYRMQATRKLIKGAAMFRSSVLERPSKIMSENAIQKVSFMEPLTHHFGPHVTGVYFNPAHYTVLESVDTFEVTVVREGGDLNQVVLVDYNTEDGSAAAESAYITASGTLTFAPGETSKSFRIRVLDDDTFAEDEHFYIHLSDVRFGQHPSAENGAHNKGNIPDQCEVRLINPYSATVMILDNDHAGVFDFESKDIETTESVGQVPIKVKRWTGARGTVEITYATIDGTAKAGKDYEAVRGELTFTDGEIEKTIQVTILEEDTYQKDVLFYVQLYHPVPLDAKGAPIRLPAKPRAQMDKSELLAVEGRPNLGPDNRVQVRIRESKQFKSAVDKLLQRANAKLIIGTSSWKEQFIEAFTIGGDDGDEESNDNDNSKEDSMAEEEIEKTEKEKKYPSFLEYVVHFLTLFWKLLSACIPPSDYCGGLLAFVVSILVIGLVTAVIGDLAAHFGCTVGLRDAITAITFVAIGTSIPDTFASKVAAVQDEYADASIGNVTGSNAVNVFLGIGIAWTVAPIVYAFRNCPPNNPGCNTFVVDPGSLAFSVTLFCSVAVVAIVVILLRRLPAFGGGELGGPARFKYSTSVLFIALWIFYLLMSSLEAYGHVQGY